MPSVAMSEVGRMRTSTTNASVVPILVTSWSAIAAVVLLKMRRLSTGTTAVLKQPLLLVPARRAPRAFVQVDARRVAEHAARFRDVRRAILAEELDAARIERRLDAERAENGFADV